MHGGEAIVTKEVMGHDNEDGRMGVEAAVLRMRSKDAAGMWMRTYLDQWVEVRLPPYGGKISVTVHSETSNRLERRALDQVERMIRGGYWFPFAGRPAAMDATRADAAIARRQELSKVVKARGLMAKAFDVMELPELRDRLLSLPEDGMTRESMMAAIGGIALSFVDSGGEPASDEAMSGNTP